MTRVLLALLVLTLLLLTWRFLLWQPRPLPGVTRQTPLLVGHRGVREIRPENTLAAFEYAFEAGLDGVEFDVQRTRDGYLVLFHDYEIEGQQLSSLTLQEVQALDERVPTLEQLFELAERYPGTLLNVELKSESTGTDGLEHDAVAAIRASGLSDRVIVSSFNPVSLARVRLRANELRTGLLYAPDLPRYLRSGWLAGWLHVDALHPHESQVTPALLRRARTRRVMLNTWTVNDPMRITSLHDGGVTAIMGDNPATLLANGR